jgi:hypothetical protein
MGIAAFDDLGRDFGRDTIAPWRSERDGDAPSRFQLPPA